MKAADISDEVIKTLVASGIPSLYAIQEHLAFPPKVVLAKIRQMVNKGRLIGCACGCRGDFEIPATPEEGRAARKRRLAAKPILPSKGLILTYDIDGALNEANSMRTGDREVL